MADPDLLKARERLAGWFRQERRTLPWRGISDPWAILLSEILLQQTTVAEGEKRFDGLLRRFPTPLAMAQATEEEVLKAWEGLGYYGRARRLRKAAQACVQSHEGRVPARHTDLLSLPGVGAYTAAAVASIAFGAVVPAVDGNAVRVLSRLSALRSRVDRAEGRRAVAALAEEFLDPSRPGDHNEALMDLGATICLPSRPACSRCPLSSLCLGFQGGDATAFPVKAPRRKPPHRHVALALVQEEGRILLVKRPPGTMLEGLWEIPGGKVRAGETTARAAERELLEETGVRANAQALLGKVRHTYTHLSVTLHLHRMETSSQGAAGTRESRWADRGALRSLPIPTGTRKALALLGG